MATSRQVDCPWGVMLSVVEACGRRPLRSCFDYAQHDAHFLYFCTMIVYNETIIVEESVYPEWINWIKEVHIPAVMATGYFTSYKILNVIDSPNEGVTNCIQYYTDTTDKFNSFYSGHLHVLHAAHHQLYENKYVLYNTLMEVIDEG